LAYLLDLMLWRRRRGQCSPALYSIPPPVSVNGMMFSFRYCYA